jgi:serine/threonine-protein kinase
VHRDVKPGNLLVQEDGTVVLVDFGVARSAAITAITAADAVPGTVLYMAPEQVSGKPVSPATDVYALGAVAYQCLSGMPPFNGEAPMQIAVKHLNDEVPPLPADLPEPVRVLVGRALAKDPAQRYPSAAAFAAATRAAAAAVGGHVPPATGAAAAGAAAAAAAAAADGPAASDGATVVDLPVAGNGARGPVRSAPVPVPVHDERPASDRPSSRRRFAALAGAAAILVVGVVLATVLALTLGDDGEPGGPGGPTEGTSVPASTGVTQPGTGRTGGTGGTNGTGPTAGGTTAPGQAPNPTQPGPTTTQEPGPTATQEPQPTPTGGGGTNGTGGTGGGDDGGGGGSGAPATG